MRKPFIAANWKMNKTLQEAKSFMEEFLSVVKGVHDVDIVIAPPFTVLYPLASFFKDTSVKLSAQNVFYEEKGAFTGEISPIMLIDAGCSYVILGHSERRQYFNETDAIINKKIMAAINHNLNVIFCVGESLEERESGKTFDVIRREIEAGLKDVPADSIVVAYEPIWAIGTGKTATPETAQEAHKHIRQTLYKIYGNAANNIRILYGGSVTPDNIDSLMACEDIDGALVGGASLKAESFVKIVKFNKI